ncbi:DUF3857 domain-containing protein [Chitinophaga lutea]|uniref:DUF3857 domain-containing protein n=1 Tax=Chitinophaga lutea TaxID=2488634 RepID=A0A3N4QCK3_9BACT|nr:DUF3857 domain-containing protein [Chitinophaga lutea]RPE13697.1 DUF3857 domain-containing protein [Chitinophaga lutea]
MYRLLFLAALLLAPCLLRAQSKNISASPAPSWLALYQPDLTRKVNAKDFSDGYYQLLYEEQHHIEKKTVYRHIIRQIESEAGIQNGSEISVDYSPEYEKLQFHQILIRRNGQVINQLNLSRIKVLQQEEELSMFIYSGQYNAYLILEDVRKGDQIEYAYSIIGENPIFNGLYSNTLYLTVYEPVANFYKALIAAPARPLHFKYYQGAPRPVEKMLNGLRLYEWDLSNKVFRLKPEDYQPSWYADFPYVDISEFTDWAAVARWGASVNNVPMNGNEVANRIVRLRKQAGNDTAKYFEAAIRFVQDDIRYMGIEMGEYSHRPNTPEKVCRQRFGDCKDKALLLTTLLRAQGIEADVAYVHTDLRGHIADRLPSPARFNHVIVKARYRDVDYWIDATQAYQRGRLHNRYNPLFRKALLVKEGITALSDIPVKNTGTLDVTELFTIHSIENDTAQLLVTSIYKGMQADIFRASSANSALSDMETSYTEFYSKKYGKVEMRDSIRISDNDSANVISVSESYTIYEPWTIDSANGMMQSFTTPAHILTSKLVFIDKGRKTPVALEFPMNVQHSIIITLPQEWQVAQEKIDIRREGYRFISKPAAVMNSVQLRYSFESTMDHIPREDLDQYRQDMNALNDAANISLTWRPGAGDTAAAGGRWAGGVNWLAILLALAAAAFFAQLGTKYYKRSLPSSYPVQQPWDIGSWLILLAIGVVISPFRVVTTVFGLEVFQGNVWMNLPATFSGKNISLIQAFLLLEVICNVFLLAVTIFNLLLFFRKRDIFPRVFSFMLAFNVVWAFVDFGIADALTGSNNFTDQFSTLLSAILPAAIWIPVMQLSKRVKHTFTLPYESA